MSAKDRRKSLALRLDADPHRALAAYARAHGARGMSAAARRCLRAELALEQDLPAVRGPLPAARGPMPAPDAAPLPDAPRPPRALRLQLEPALRAALALSGGPGDADRVAGLIARRLAALGYRGG